MDDLFKKLNVLVKAAVHDVLGDSPQQRGALPKLGKEMDREITQLRQRINEALSFEDGLQARVQSIQAEINQWDEKADVFLKEGNDANARYAVEQMQRAQQRLAIAEADLREHRLVTQELITQVNTLESAVADARRAEDQQQSAPAEAPAEVPQRPFLSDVLRNMREKLDDSVSSEAPKTEVPVPPEAPVEEQQVEDDLAQRRQRLSKPEK